jgi:serine/threonine protein kinase/tetratricopeptide (TPR) repeat protein
MNSNSSRDVAVFTAAHELPVNEREAYLAQVCGDDIELRKRVEALLRAHSELGDFMQETPATVSQRREAAIGETVGHRVGRYKLLQQIGEGGCGVVFMAEQEEPVRRSVAVKIIKPGMDTRNVIARFEAERQALALMNHPNIAKIFDAGATESGRPYFVMELVRGIKITEYCDQHCLTTQERLKLFIQVCHAVQHAHQKGIIHRDIKPSNILVTQTVEGAALPVVIDFGIAKATTNQQLTDKTLFTAFEMLIGTPAYMSPEQAALTTVDVDTRSDIYSLGVLLYELLTGSTPFDTVELSKAGFDEIRRVIREQEPARPSTRLSRLTDADLTTVAQRRHSQPPMLIRAVRGDLDWIAMKALEKDRTRRYPTANALALDVHRFIANEAISARPPGKVYKLQKAMLRNKLLFAGVSVITLLMVASLIVVSTSLTKEHRSRLEAEVASTKSRQVTRFLEDMLQGVEPSVALGQDTTMLRGILDRTAERVGKEMTNQPAIEAELRDLIGRLYFEIGNYYGAEKMHRAALAFYRKHYGPESREAAASLNDLGLALWKEGNLTDAERTHQEALGIRRALFRNEHSEVATSLNNLATVYRHQRKLEEAEAGIREALRIRQKLFGEENLQVADSLHNLSLVLGDQRKWAEAEAMARKVLAMRRRLLGNDHPLVAAALLDVANALGSTGKSEEAESLQEEAFTMQRKLLGDEHPDVSTSLSSLGTRMRERGDLREAQTVSSAALSMQRKILGKDSPEVLSSLESLGSTLKAQGKLSEAEAAFREAWTGWRKREGNEGPHTLSALDHVARVLIAQKKSGEAEQLLDETLTPALVRQASCVQLLAVRVKLKARRAQWQQAADDAARVFEYRPSDHGRFPILAALLIKTQNRTAYETLRAKLLTSWSDTTNFFVADQVAKACLFLPYAQAYSKLISHLADLPVANGTGNEGAMPYFQNLKALSEYREAHYDQAVEWCQKALDRPPNPVHAYASAILAMAYWKLEKKEDAQAMLAKGDFLAPREMPASVAEDPGDAWLAWLYARIQLDEAAALIRSNSTQPQPQPDASNQP